MAGIGKPEVALTPSGEPDVASMLGGMDIMTWVADQKDAIWALAITGWSYELPVPVLDGGQVTGAEAFARVRALDPDPAESLDMLQHLAFLAPRAVIAAADAAEHRRTPTYRWAATGLAEDAKAGVPKARISALLALAAERYGRFPEQGIWHAVIDRADSLEAPACYEAVAAHLGLTVGRSAAGSVAAWVDGRDVHEVVAALHAAAVSG